MLYVVNLDQIWNKKLLSSFITSCPPTWLLKINAVIIERRLSLRFRWFIRYVYLKVIIHFSDKNILSRKKLSETEIRRFGKCNPANT